MENQQSNIPQPHPLTRQIASLAGELNIARRNWHSYPAGHPMIETSLQRFSAAWQTLFSAAPGIRIGITKDGLLVDDHYIDKGNAACRIMATAMFERGIGGVQVHGTPATAEVRNILDILAMKREDILADGGVEQLWQNAGISSIELFAIRYDLFTSAEDAEDDDISGMSGETLWERFVKNLINNMMGSDADAMFEPASLAALLNSRFAKDRHIRIKGLEAAFALLRGTNAAKHEVAGGGASINPSRDVLVPAEVSVPADMAGDSTAASPAMLHEKASPVISHELIVFIKNLDPFLRRQIIDGFCETSGDDGTESEQLCRELGMDLMKETYGTADQYATAPTLLKGVLEKLVAEEEEARAHENSLAERRKRLKLLLQEHQAEIYIPDSYFRQLQDLLANTKPTPLVVAEITDLLKGLETQSIENRTSEIILQLVINDPDGEDAVELIHNLADLCGSFLETGDYGQVLKVFAQAADPRLPQQMRIKMRDAFCRREFLDEILSGLVIWGKPKYDDVATLIQVVGTPFINPLLDRLADEGNMSLRRFLMDRIQRFGTNARPAIISKLTDNRWYYVRNLVILLRAVDPHGAVDHLRPLLKNANPKVRTELLKSLLIAGDPIAERQILRELGSAEKEVQLAAVHLSDLSRSIDIQNKLVSILLEGGFSAIECEIKSAAIQSLATSGQPAVIQHLVKLLSSKSLLHFKQLNRLKLEIVKSLERYPEAAAAPVLASIATGSDEPARQAAESLKNIRSVAR